LQGVLHIRRSREIHTEFWLGDLRERDHLEDLGIDGRIILKWILQKYDRSILTGYIKRGTETSGGLL
jgi:hypothetical protein